MGSRGSQDGLAGGRPKSVGSGSSSSSSSSSGRGSLSPVGYLCGPKRRVVSGGLGGYISPPGALEEDDLDHGGGCQNLLCECASKACSYLIYDQNAVFNLLQMAQRISSTGAQRNLRLLDITSRARRQFCNVCQRSLMADTMFEPWLSS